MKKIMIFALLAAWGGMLIGCQTETAPVTLMVPSGSPALSQLYLQDDEENYQVSVVNGADPLVAAFGSGSHDVIFAPTNLGAKLISSGADYRFAGTVTWGNYYLVGKSATPFTLESLEGKTVVVFGQNQTSDIIVKFLFSEHQIAPTLQYVDAVSTATAQFLADDSLIILTAEPSLSVLLSTQPDIDVIDLQTEYATLTGDSSYPQAGVFLKAGLDPSNARKLLDDLNSSIDRVIADPAAAAALAVSMGHTFSESVLVSAIPNSHLQWKNAAESKSALETYFTMILENNGSLIGGRLPDDDFYWVP